MSLVIENPAQSPILPQPVRTSATQWTVGDLAARFGAIPLSRIVIDPAPGTATEEDVLWLDDHEDCLCELIDGTLVEKTMGWFESWLAANLIGILKDFVTQRNLGIILGPDGMLKLFPDQVRIPDVCFISWERYAKRPKVKERILSVAPDLAAEIISGGNTPQEMDRKLREYFESGTRLVWYFYLDKREVHVYTAVEQVQVLNESGTLDGGEVLPGFSLPLTGFFDEPQPPSAPDSGERTTPQ